MTVTYDQLVDLWGPTNLIHFPIRELLSVIEFGPDALPPDGAMPIEVPILFTAAVSDGGIELFTQLKLDIAGRPSMRLIVIGAVPADQKMLYAVDAASGGVVLVDVEEPTVEVVNSTFAIFVEFLYRVGQLIQNDPGGVERARRAQALRAELVELDPLAFGDPQSWWSIAFDQLLASR